MDIPFDDAEYCPDKDGSGHPFPVEDIKLPIKDCYYGNILIKRAHVKLDYSKQHITEIVKCKRDPVYFIENYCRIISLDEGIVPFRMYDYQKEMVEMYTKNRFNLSLTSRQMGKCLTLNTNITIRNKRGEIYDIPIGLFHRWQRARADGTKIPDIKRYLRT